MDIGHFTIPFRGVVSADAARSHDNDECSRLHPDLRSHIHTTYFFSKM